MTEANEGRRTTSKDVAREAHVSQSTVSRVLSGSDRPIAEETAQRVRNAAEALGYTPDPLARALKLGLKSVQEPSGEPRSGILLRNHVWQRVLSQQLIERYKEGTTPVGYDLRLGSYEDPKDNSVHELSEKQTLVIAPSSMVRVFSYETVNLPLDLTAMTSLRSTWARLGIMYDARHFEAGFSGNIPLELQNPTEQPLSIPSREGVARIIFQKLPEAVSHQPKEEPDQVVLVGKPTQIVREVVSVKS